MGIGYMVLYLMDNGLCYAGVLIISETRPQGVMEALPCHLSSALVSSVRYCSLGSLSTLPDREVGGFIMLTMDVAHMYCLVVCWLGGQLCVLVCLNVFATPIHHVQQVFHLAVVCGGLLSADLVAATAASLEWDITVCSLSTDIEEDFKLRPGLLMDMVNEEVRACALLQSTVVAADVMDGRGGLYDMSTVSNAPRVICRCYT
jgi:hypothetical protein